MSILLRSLGGWLAAALLLAACWPGDASVSGPAPPNARSPVREAPDRDHKVDLAASDRPAGDLVKDAYRKPAEVLAFSRVGPGHHVFEMEAGAGYFTELFSRAVGPAGEVIMQQPKEFLRFYEDQLNRRLQDNRLANVTQSWSMFDKLEAADGSMDIVTWFQGPHELFCNQACGNLRMGDINSVFREVSRILKPGGFFIVMDHRAPTGAPTTTGNDLHRIDPLVVKAAATTAGFALDEESDMLANPADDYAKDVFDKVVQGKTDQFLLRYRKP